MKRIVLLFTILLFLTSCTDRPNTYVFKQTINQTVTNYITNSSSNSSITGTFSNFQLANVSNTTSWSNIINIPSFSNFQLGNVSNNTINPSQLDNNTIIRTSNLSNILVSNSTTASNVNCAGIQGATSNLCTITGGSQSSQQVFYMQGRVASTLISTRQWYECGLFSISGTANDCANVLNRGLIQNSSIINNIIPFNGTIKNMIIYAGYVPAGFTANQSVYINITINRNITSQGYKVSTNGSYQDNNVLLNVKKGDNATMVIFMNSSGELQCSACQSGIINAIWTAELWSS